VPTIKPTYRLKSAAEALSIEARQDDAIQKARFLVEKLKGKLIREPKEATSRVEVSYTIDMEKKERKKSKNVVLGFNFHPTQIDNDYRDTQEIFATLNDGEINLINNDSTEPVVEKNISESSITNVISTLDRIGHLAVGQGLVSLEDLTATGIFTEEDLAS
jgi:beta-glucosidase/6-phospho-beta-glucosidase/beta-galactosidase